MNLDIPIYKFPDSTKKFFIDAALHANINCYLTEDISAYLELAKLLEQSLIDSGESTELLNELYSYRKGTGHDAFMITNLPIDPVLPDTPRLENDIYNLGSGYKPTFVSESIHITLYILMGLQPLSQPGMQNGKIVTQVISLPEYNSEQSNRGYGKLALHTEISSAPDNMTPYVQSLIGLRDANNSISHRVATPLVSVDYIYSLIDPSDIEILKMPIFNFSSGPAIKEEHRISRIRPIITTNKRDQIEFRFHSDPSRICIDRNHEIAQNTLNRLFQTLDITKNPDLNSNAVEIRVGYGLFWKNKRFLHGRSDINYLLQNCANGHLPSQKLVQDMFGSSFSYDKLPLSSNNSIRWLQRMRGI